MAALLAVVLAGCGASRRPAAQTGAAPRRAPAHNHASHHPDSHVVAVTVPATTTATGSSDHHRSGASRDDGAGAQHRSVLPADAGRLPQTPALPPASSPQLTAEMRDLWRGVVSGRVAPALPAFFPEAAYLQVKAIPDPAADWRERLVGGFAADIAAAHALLGSGAAGARLLGVRVPESYAHWVTPGVCYNSVGYWEVPNARVVYREHGAVRSFGIASMISWRGVWYVVHLGAVLRSGPGGVVDDPSSGPGVSAYSSTC
jgi:hypothetical protein